MSEEQKTTDNKLTVTTIKAGYNRKFNLGDYNSLGIDIEVWASVEPDADIAQAVSGLRQLARNHVMVEAANVIGKLRARTEFLYMGKPVVGVADEIDEGDQFYTGEAISLEVQELLRECGINPADVFIRSQADRQPDEESLPF